MKYVHRAQENRIFHAFAGSMITCILGPRRVGKSTLIENYFSTHHVPEVVHLNMDNMQARDQVKNGQLEDMILRSIKRHFEPQRRIWVAIDEAQKCPELFEQIKLLYDRYKDQDAIKFILTGSALLELHRLSAESLAGRIQLYYLSLFTLNEAAAYQYTIKRPTSVFTLIQQNDWDISLWEEVRQQARPYENILTKMLDNLLVWGGFPEILTLSYEMEKLDYLGNYIQTYLEKDVRAVQSITDLALYRKLMDIAAEQTGSLRDDTKILQALGCHRDTLNKYRGYLQATLIYQEIYPYINSNLKRLVKAPKGYLVDNGFLSFLSGLYDGDILYKTGQMGHRLENWFLNELQVWLNQQPGHHRIHYWRTSAGVEVDFVVYAPPHVIPFEVTMGTSIEPKKVKNLMQFRAYEPNASIGYYIYQGPFHWDEEKRIIFLPAWSIF